MDKVWILATGGLDEAGSVLGVYGLKNTGVADFVEQTYALAMRFGDINQAWQDDDGSLHVQAGGNWAALTPHAVAWVPQLMPAGQPPLWLVEHEGGWCALPDGVEPDPEARWDPTVCGCIVTMRGGRRRGMPDCPDCLARLSSPMHDTRA